MPPSFPTRRYSDLSALTPFPKPEPTDDVANADAHAFAGSWAIRNPTMTMGEPDRSLAICSLPIRIEAMGDKTMIYYQPGETRSGRSEEHTSELQSLMRISYAVFCLKKNNTK